MIHPIIAFIKPIRAVNGIIRPLKHPMNKENVKIKRQNSIKTYRKVCR